MVPKFSLMFFLKEVELVMLLRGSEPVVITSFCKAPFQMLSTSKTTAEIDRFHVTYCFDF